jgi:UDP-4-amino-4,6-dideoxy-N-acetyl-beta-L-altrosamine transaminase
MLKRIPYGSQKIDSADIAAVVKALKSDFLTQGPRIEQFEQAIAKYVNAKFAVAFNNGASALTAACFAAGIGADDEVILSPYTFLASANCFVWLGAKPVFVDINPETLNIDPSFIEAVITPKTKAILTVDFAGLPCDYDAILKIAKKHNLLVIDDAAHALGSVYKNKKIGSIADMTAFSFHPVKTITTGEGGMVTTSNKRFLERLKIFRNHGITKDKNKMSKSDGLWYYEMIELGQNLRLTDFQSALGLSQLKKIESFIKRRREIVNIYNRAFQGLPLTLPRELSNCKTAWHLYPVRLDLPKLKVGRKQIFDSLQDRGLGVQVHYIPVHLQPYYKKKFGVKKGDFPVSEQVYVSVLSLPLHPSLTTNDVKYVVKTFKNVIKKCKK